MALARFNDYKKNGRRTSVVFREEWKLGLKSKKKKQATSLKGRKNTNDLMTQKTN